MKKFIKDNLSIIIIVGIILIVGTVLTTAIIVQANRKPAEYIIQENTLVKYQGSGETVKIPSEVKSIGASTFLGKAKIEKVTFSGNNTTIIGYKAFANCSKLESITLPSSVKEIGNEVFSGCSALTTITIPEGVTSLGDKAFSGCLGLTTINLPASLETLGEEVFSGCNNLTTINLASGNTKYVIEDNVLYNSDKSTLILYIAAAHTNDTYTVSDTVKTIQAKAFSKANALTTLVIGSNVKTIGKGILSGCENISTLTIPFVGSNISEAGKMEYFYDALLPETLEKVTILGGKTIGALAFRNCTNLKRVYLPDTLEVIDMNAFFGCSKLLRMELPATVKSINERAFENCSSMLSINIPSSVTYIGQWAFKGCTLLTIECETYKAPSTWDPNWNVDNVDVEWNMVK